ncbi:MAG: lipopolysaccharide transport periplasmic protein LptA [Thiotrichaceae bacterium]
MNKSNFFILVTLLSLFLLSPKLLALTSDTRQPVKIDASSVTFNKTKGYAIYEGGVSIVQGTLKIQASKIEIFAPNNAIQRIEATGSPVSFEQKMDDGKWAKGKANTVRFLVKEKKLILAGNATLSQDKDTFSSQHIQYSTRTGELKAGKSKKASKKPNDRVRAIFYPAQ